MRIPPSVSTSVGSLLIVELRGHMSLYIAEVVQERPLVVKVTEDGELSRVPAEHIENIDQRHNVLFQKSREDAAFVLTQLTSQHENWPLSGLRSLGLNEMTDVDSIECIQYPVRAPVAA